MSFGDFLRILRGRFGVALAVMLITVGIALSVSLLLPKQYKASTSLVIDFKSPDPIAGTLLPALAMPAYMATQVEIISSDRVAEHVVRKLGLAADAQLREDWLAATQGKGSIETWLVQQLQKRVTVAPARQSNVLTISYKATSPKIAAVTANAFAHAYLETALALRVEPAREYAKLFGEQATALRDNLTAAQVRLLAYQQEKGIVVNDQRLDYETARLNELSTQLTVAQGQSAEARSRQLLRGAADTHPEIVQNPLIQGLKIEIARQEAKLSELSLNVGRNHPQLQRAAAEIASLNEKLELETQKIRRSFSTSGSVSTAKEAELRATIAAQRRRLLELQSQRGELAVFVRDVEAAQKAFDAVSQRFSQTNLESHSNQANIAMLTSASEPIDPVFPKLVLNTGLSIFFGTLLGIGVAFLLEIFDRRIRSSRDLTEILELRVLGVIPTRVGRERISAT